MIDFTKKTWVDGPQGGTPITAAELNRHEDTLASLATASDRSANVVALGVDNTGATDCADRLQEVVDGAEWGVYLPAGTYLIGKPIRFPYDTARPFGIRLDPGARIVAGAEMDAMLDLGVVKRDGAESELHSLEGGLLDGNGLARIGVRTSAKLTGMRISGLTITGCVDYGIYQERPASTSSHDSRISDVRINYVHQKERTPLGYTGCGIYFGGGDASVSDFYIASCATGIKSENFIHVDNGHIFDGYCHNKTTTVGIEAGQLVGGVVYIDSTNVGVRSYSWLQISNLFYFAWEPLNKPVVGVQGVWDQPVKLGSYRFVINGSQEDGRSVQLYSDRTLTTPVTSAEGLSVDHATVINASSAERVCSLNLGGHGENGTRVSSQYVTLKNGQGIRLCWVPKPRNDGWNSSEAFSLIAENCFFDADATVTVVRVDSNENGIASRTVRYFRINYSPDDTAKWELKLGAPETLAGVHVWPLYLFVTVAADVSVTLPPLLVHHKTETPNGFLWDQIPATPINLSDITVIK